MRQTLFSDFYYLCKDAVDARKSNSKSPHINKVEKECREKWEEYTGGESKVMGFDCLGKKYTDSSVRAAYTSFFFDLCKNENYRNIFKNKGYFYSPNMLMGDKDWRRDFAQVDEEEFFHVDCQVFVFLLKAVKAIIDLGDSELLKKCSIIHGKLEENEVEDISPNETYVSEDFELDFNMALLEKMLQADNGVLFRVEKEAIKYLITCNKREKEAVQVYIKRAEIALKKLKKCKLI